MFLKTVKGKIVAGVATVGLLGGVGFAFANTDAGEQLRNWYEAQFNQSKAKVEAATDQYIQERTGELQAEYNDAKSNAGNDIDTKGNEESGRVQSEIENAKNSHLAALDGAKQEIMDSMGLQFYNLFQEGYLKIVQKANEAENFATNDLSAFTSQKGEAAIQKLTSEINTAKDAAVQDLQAAIEAAKAELTSELLTAEAYTKTSLQNQVDWAIEDLRETVEGIIADFVLAQQELIADAAAQLEAEAKAALDEVVSGINN
ncbi:hypothetical protein [Bacillus kwashiorkori]|uniref:hypothetical protein n=1 Tax=Bacillus kwashiorkori TaxID=1522318 RepID=UPI000781DE23|nr:hypothetical protein [Bacillus kwashiorkori]